MERLRVFRKPGRYAVIEDIVVGWQDKKLTEDEKDAVRKAIGKKWKNFITKKKIVDHAVPVWVIEDHECIARFPKEMHVWKPEMEDPEWRIKAEQEERERIQNNIRESTRFKGAVKIPYDEPLMDVFKTKRVKGVPKEELVGYRLESINWGVAKCNQAWFKEKAKLTNTEVFNPKTGNIKLGKNEKKAILDAVRKLVIEEDRVNAKLSLAILDKEYERIGMKYEEKKNTLF